MHHLLAILVAVTPAAAAERAPELIVPGVYPRGAVEVEDGDRALALCGRQLHSVQVSVRALDGGERVHVTAPCAAKFIVRNVPSLRPRATVPAAVQVGGRLSTSPFGPRTVELRLGGRTWQVERVRLGSTGYRLVLEGPGVSEPVTLYECQSTDAALWELLWAGDADGDGKIDLLIDASDAYDLSEVRLFLSRGAEEAVDEVDMIRRKRDLEPMGPIRPLTP